MIINITFDDGSTVSVPESIQETDEVIVKDREGNDNKTTWGSVIAHTNGEALDLFEQNKPNNWLDSINQRITGYMPK